MNLQCEINISFFLGDHNHPPDETAVVKVRIRMELKEKVASNPHVAAPTLYNQELLRASQAVSVHFVKVRS